MERRKRYTIVLLPQGPGKVRSFSIPLRLAKVVLLCLLFATVGVSWVIYDYGRMRSGYQEIYRLKRENVDQRIAIRSMASKLSDLEEELIRLKTFDKRLRVIADLEDKGNGRDQPLGVGGPSPEDEISLKGDGQKVLKGLQERLSLLEKEIEREKASFNELHSYLLDRKVRLASTPSIWPARGWVASGFGYRVSPFTGLKQFHQGIDIANRPGTPVIAPANGVVVKVGVDYSFGKYIVISHGYGITTRYGHLSKILVKRGQRVKRGQVIGRMGNTGRSTGPHLHYEVVVNGRHVDPMRYILD